MEMTVYELANVAGPMPLLKIDSMSVSSKPSLRSIKNAILKSS